MSCFHAFLFTKLQRLPGLSGEGSSRPGGWPRPFDGHLGVLLFSGLLLVGVPLKPQKK